MVVDAVSSPLTTLVVGGGAVDGCHCHVCAAMDGVVVTAAVNAAAAACRCVCMLHLAVQWWLSTSIVDVSRRPIALVGAAHSVYGLILTNRSNIFHAIV